MRIRISAFIVLSSALIYCFRQSILKRPHNQLAVFKYPKFWIGLLLLGLYYGTKETLNIIYGYTSSVLQWSPMDVMILGLCNIAGVVSFMIISAKILVSNKTAIIGFLIAGFGMLLIYHLWMYFIFTPDLAFADLLVPMFLQGAASGLLFVPIMLFVLRSVPPATGITAVALAGMVRFISLLNVSAGFYNLQLYYNQLYRESFLSHLTDGDEQMVERLNGFRQLFMSKGYAADQANALANASLAKILGMQSQLLANRATFIFITVVIAVILVSVILTGIGRFVFSRRQL
jgi:DHA2 family multidrug resistance protein